MAEETKPVENTEETLSPEKIKQLLETVNFQAFFSDPIKSNSTLYQGMKLILERNINIEKTLTEIKQILEKNGNKG